MTDFRAETDFSLKTSINLTFRSEIEKMYLDYHWNTKINLKENLNFKKFYKLFVCTLI